MDTTFSPATVPEVEADALHDRKDKLGRLSRIDILRALPPEEIQALIPYVKRQEFPAGATIIRLGDPGDALYFIDSGVALIERPGLPDGLRIGPGAVVGEASLLTGEPRSATVTSETPISAWRIDKASFDWLVARSPNLRRALEALLEQWHAGTSLDLPSHERWVSTALRAIEARRRGLTLWQILMIVGLLIWSLLGANEHAGVVHAGTHRVEIAILQLMAGMLIIQGSAEAFLHGVERLGARLRWDGFLSGTMGSLFSSLPEFVMIGFLVKVDPLAAFVTAVVTIFNNALAFSIYSFFLPKDRKGAYEMPRSLTSAGGDILIAGGAISLIIGLVMLVVRVEKVKTSLGGMDLIGIGLVLMVIYAYYVLTLVKYYGEGKDDDESLPPDPSRLGHDTSRTGITLMFVLGIIGAYCGGESIGGFAESALNHLGLPTIPTAAALAFFTGVSEYIIVYKSHRRGELGIALSTVFGGLTEVMFLLLPFGMIAIGVVGMVKGDPHFAIPITVATMMLMLLLFPLFYALHSYFEQEKALSNLDAAAMTGIYLLLLYFLFTSPA
jgi:hypothetical protein